MEELNQIPKILQNEKNPSLNGFPMDFFQRFLDIMGKDIIEVIEETKKNGKILQAFNSTSIITIPKENNPRHFDQ